MKLNNKGFCCIPHLCVVVVKSIATAAGHGAGGTSPQYAAAAGPLAVVALFILLIVAPNIKHWEHCKSLPDGSVNRGLCQAENKWPLK